MPQKRVLVSVECITCKTTWDKRKDSLKEWIGRCHSCESKRKLESAEAREALAIRARKQVLSQGGIPNARKITSSTARGPKNYTWKGDAIGYHGLHSWLRKNYERGTTCEHCKSNKNLQWANKSQLYRKDRSDWLTLCAKCHKTYDLPTRGNIKRAFGEISKSKDLITSKI